MHLSEFCEDANDKNLNDVIRQAHSDRNVTGCCDKRKDYEVK
jgi:hypothetical protein